jgi:hypothetical protein
MKKISIILRQLEKLENYKKISYQKALGPYA